ncbi:MAG: AAA family ATPase [bacterium]|nr:AAA family ATPase [bacterium]
MKLILITGLDGSGKSTLISRLEAHKNEGTAFLRAPVINAEVFEENQKLYKASLFINWLNTEADSLNVPQLKAAALFASMLIFKDLLEEFRKKNVDLVFCERHPLIDTAVYARFYADKMHPKSIPVATLAEIDYNFNAELGYFTKMMNLKKQDMPHGALHALLLLMYNWFYIHKKFALEHLKELFSVEMPSKIYYLKADADVLFQRIAQRDVLEPHETEKVLAKFIPVYDQVLADAKTETEVVNANEVKHLDGAYHQIRKNYFPAL